MYSAQIVHFTHCNQPYYVQMVDDSAYYQKITPLMPAITNAKHQPDSKRVKFTASAGRRGATGVPSLSSTLVVLVVVLTALVSP